jgi:predicted O-linked N-acetylglucosamine transferase (SPINDLY family)
VARLVQAAPSARHVLIRLIGRALRRRDSTNGAGAVALQRADGFETAGTLEQAVEAYREALALDPGNAVGWNNLGWTLQRLERLEEAQDAYRQALALDPSLVISRNNIGTIHRLRGNLDAALAEYLTALAKAPHDAVTQINLGTVLLKQGEAERALDYFRGSVAMMPQLEEAHRALLLAMNYLPGVDPAEAFAYYRTWGMRCAARVRRRHPRRDTDPRRRLRVGYVSPDFRNHAMAPFIEQVLANHSASAVEVFCYDNSPAKDAVTARMQGYPALWRDIRGVDDDTAADLVEQDHIDLLVDLAGHTVGGRLELFARRPAPVQISLLGYLNTTGLDAMDYRISDVTADPPGIAERYHVERMLRLPGSFWCFRPPDDAPYVGPAPALAAGRVTFGSFNNFAKLNRAVTDAWSSILHRCPDARLLVAAAPEGEARARFLERFAAHGIEAARIELFGRLRLSEFRALHARVDIALDPFPYAGGATSCESLWMGVPVVTLAGTFGFARSGACLLNALELGELIAENAGEYVECATRLAADHSRLGDLRRSLRGRMQDSELTDGARFAAKLEAAYRGVWHDWCGVPRPGPQRVG